MAIKPESEKTVLDQIRENIRKVRTTGGLSRINELLQAARAKIQKKGKIPPEVSPKPTDASRVAFAAKSKPMPPFKPKGLSPTKPILGAIKSAFKPPVFTRTSSKGSVSEKRSIFENQNKITSNNNQKQNNKNVASRYSVTPAVKPFRNRGY